MLIDTTAGATGAAGTLPFGKEVALGDNAFLDDSVFFTAPEVVGALNVLAAEVTLFEFLSLASLILMVTHRTDCKNKLTNNYFKI